MPVLMTADEVAEALRTRDDALHEVRAIKHELAVLQERKRDLENEIAALAAEHTRLRAGIDEIRARFAPETTQ